jgi:hypothetical protein
MISKISSKTSPASTGNQLQIFLFSFPQLVPNFSSNDVWKLHSKESNSKFAFMQKYEKRKREMKKRRFNVTCCHARDNIKSISNRTKEDFLGYSRSELKNEFTEEKGSLRASNE